MIRCMIMRFFVQLVPFCNDQMLHLGHKKFESGSFLLKTYARVGKFARMFKVAEFKIQSF